MPAIKAVHVLALIGAFLAGIGFDAGWLSPASQPAVAAVDTDLRDALSAMNRQLDSIDARLAAIEAPEQMDAAQFEAPYDPARAGEQRTEFRRELDDTMERDGTHGARTREFVAIVDQTLAALSELDTQRLDATCSASYCRLIVRHLNRDQQTEFAERIQGRRGFDGEGTAHLEEDGTTYLYLRVADASRARGPKSLD